MHLLKHAKDVCIWDNEIIAWSAAEAGQLDVLQWMSTNGCDFDAKTCAAAAEGGYLDVLKWLRAKGSRWDENTCTRAAEGGHVQVLEWATAEGCDIDDTIICEKACDRRSSQRFKMGTQE